MEAAFQDTLEGGVRHQPWPGKLDSVLFGGGRYQAWTREPLVVGSSVLEGHVAAEDGECAVSWGVLLCLNCLSSLVFFLQNKMASRGNKSARKKFSNSGKLSSSYNKTLVPSVHC